MSNISRAAAQWRNEGLSLRRCVAARDLIDNDLRIEIYGDLRIAELRIPI